MTPLLRAAVRAALPLAAALVGCSTARLPVPETLGTSPLPVERPTVRTPETGLAFGAYAAVDVERSWTRGRGARSPRARAGAARQSFAFTLTGDVAPWRVACETTAHDVTLRRTLDVELTAGASLECTMHPDGADDADSLPWRLVLRSRGDRPLQGTLAHRSDTFEIDGTEQTTRGLPLDETAGYVFRRGDHPVGAVETINDGAVWLHDALAPSDRTALAATAAALLLLDELDAELAMITGE